VDFSDTPRKIGGASYLEYGQTPWKCHLVRVEITILNSISVTGVDNFTWSLVAVYGATHDEFKAIFFVNWLIWKRIIHTKF
jgi:hypothetical protein